MKSKILIIDDEEEVRDYLQEFLALRGYEAFIAANGEDGVALAGKVHPDLILLDVMMPGCDGFAVQKQLSHQEAKVPILVMSGQCTKQMRDRARDSGAAAFLEKPLDVHFLTSQIEHHLKS